MQSFIRINRKWIGLALTFVLLAGILIPQSGTARADGAPELLAQWSNFSDSDTTTYYANDGIEANKNNPSTVIAPIGAGAIGVAGTNPKSVTTTGWVKGVSYWLVKLSTEGYDNITLSSVQQSSNTGPQTFVLEYSTDNESWKSDGTTYVVANDPTTGVISNHVLPADVNDSPNVYIRWRVADNSTAVNGTAIGTAGTSRIGNITVSGTPVGTTTPVAVAGVSLNESELTLQPGGTEKLTASIQPSNATNKAVVWTSSDETVASVNNGTVTANAVGTATITVTTADGGFQDTAQLTVDDTPIAVTGVNLDNNNLSLDVGQTGQLTAKVEPTNATNKAVQWASNNTAVATVDGTGNVTAVAAGSAIITATTADGSYTASASVTVSTPATYTAGDVVISQLYANGGNGGAFYNTKYFELYNRTNEDISFNNKWSLVYTSQTGTSIGSGYKLSGTIKAHGYYLVSGSTAATGGPLPIAADQAAGTALSPSASAGGIITLAYSTTGLTGQDDPRAIDIVAFGDGSNTAFKLPTDHWGAPFYNSLIKGGAIVRKTDSGSDPRHAFGLGNGYFNRDTANDFVLNSPDVQTDPKEIVLHNSKTMTTPDASKITFSASSSSLLGAAGSVPASAAVSAYVVADGTVKQVGQAAASADGSFSLTLNDVQGSQAVYVTFKDGTQPESFYAHVDAAPAATSAIADIEGTDTNGVPLNVGYATTIEGVVTSANNAIGTENTSYYVQDATGGIHVVSAQAPADTIQPGHKVKLEGKAVFAAGSMQFVPSSVTDEGMDTLVAAATTSIADLGDYAKAEQLEGTLVTVRGKVTNIPKNGPDYNISIADDDGNVAIVKIAANSGIDINTAVSLGDTFGFTGVVEQTKWGAPYTSGYYLVPRNTADIKGDMQFSHTPLVKAYIGLDIPFTVKAKYADSVTLYYKNEGDASFAPIPMVTTDNLNYNARIPKENVTATNVYYYIEAETSGQPNQSSGSAAAPHLVPVVSDTDGPAYSDEQPAQNDQVESFHPVVSVNVDDPNGVDATTLGISIDGKDFTAKAELSETQIKLALTADDDLPIGTHTVQVSGKDNLGNASTHTWTFEILERFTGGNHYRGTTHNHTNISHDAQGAPEDALKAAKAHGYDYFAFSDHSHDIDSNLVGQDTVDHNGMPERTGGSDWQLTKDLANEYTKDGSFVVFPAFEMTSTTWGHSNVFGTTNFIDRVQNGGTYQSLQNYYAWTLTYDNIVAQFNHPAMGANAFDNFIPYDKNVDKLFTMLEVGNGSGNYSYVNAEDKFFSALDLGWHVAPTYGEDNHDGTWGQTKKRTIIVAKDLTQDSLLDAMRNMHVYFSEDPNAQLDVLANGYYMGATVDSKTLNFDVTGSDAVSESASDPEYSFITTPSNDNIAKVELVTNGGRVIDTYTPSSDSTSFNWKPVVNVVGGQQWFVIRVTQKDGDRTYSAPIWSPQDPLSVKVNDLSVAEGAAIAGVPATLKAGLSNLGTISLTNLTAHFYYDSIDAQHLIGDATIESLASNQSATASVSWANPTAGDHKLIVVLEAGDGNDLGENKFEQALSVKAPLGIKVMIDATHNNENTSSDTGSYKDNLTSLTLTLKQQGYTVVENKTALTASLLADVGVLVVTHPSTQYTAGEIDVLKNYVDGGGALLMSEKSNYNGTPQNLNSLLAGIGSSMLVNNDGVFDETKEGNFWSTPLTSNFSVRLHNQPVNGGLTDFIPLLDFYSGSSLAANDGSGGKKALTDSDNVTILARGNETTFQDSPQVKADTYAYNVQTSKGKDGPALTDVTGGSVIPLVAAEQIGNGRIVLSGMNIFNDKQMTQNDGPTNNIPFSVNVVNWLAHLEPKVMPINEARQQPEGTSVMVEGQVTTTAFYDSAYIQDATGGVVAFSEVPAGSLKLGDTVRVYGHISTFENDKELVFDRFANSIVVLKSGSPVAPKLVSTADSVSDAYQGQLVQVEGIVKEIKDSSTYIINDGSGDVTVFVDGYIINQSGVPVPDMKVGDTLKAVGLSGKYSLGNRIRVRDTHELSVNQGETTAVTGVGLDKSEFTMTLGDDPYVLTATVAPANATNKNVTWSSDAESVATVDASGHVTAVAPGTAKITVTTDDGGFTASATVTVQAKSGSDNNQHGTAPSVPDKTYTLTTGSLTDIGSGIKSAAIPAGTQEVKLAADLANTFKGESLLLNAGDLSLTIPGELLQQLIGKLPADAQSKSTITLQLIPLASGEAAQVIAKGEAFSGAELKPAGDIYSFRLSITAAGGKTAELSTFSEPILIKLKVGSGVNPALSGVYYIADNGTLEYIGGTYKDGYMTAQISHFSQYAVLEYDKRFGDVPADYWAADVIRELTAKHIVNGTSTNTFEPKRNVTRAEFVAQLVRALHLTEKGQASFADVKTNDWFAEDVAIAVQAGIVQGKTSTMFDPNASITREEMTVMLMRAYAHAGGATSAGSDEAVFKDEANIAPWAIAFIKSAAELHLVQGRGEGNFDPKGITTRAESAQIVYNLLHH
ncbi:Ig-like domain-containing protein [Paenibacillus protaetiae]|uniref:Ig domain-containing protein group 2 domain-containing protein n=1 Tax=Paenibacillus protaetiae TaxID=2509456 RepID=A0A4P6F0P5_9BACL|nr:Ig-like domain-containing protein [Paenibacillus protaetiae]QAY66567.1 Ig domain-containing protein group 2 domain-containing protein [Paenibacillus protaetiae]